MQASDAGLRAVVLGSAAGGGVPQWNCFCRVCSLARAGAPGVRVRTQVGVAVSADRRSWLLVGASPDLREQILARDILAPRRPPRDTPIIGAVVLNGDVDAIAGLLVLRETAAFRLYAATPVLDVLRSNPIFGVLDPALVERVPVAPWEAIDCGHGLVLTLVPMPGKIPLYLEDRSASEAAAGPSYAALVESGGRRLLIAPNCAELTDEVRDLLRQADAILFDGTVFTDDEMLRAGVGRKTGRRMGHVPMSGPEGSLARLADVPARRIFIHINNTNPVLIEDSPERHEVETAGWEVAYDGMEVDV